MRLIDAPSSVKKNPKRPISIIIFELIFLTTLFLGISNISSSTGLLLAGQIIVMALFITLVLLVSRKRHKIAMWFLVAFTLPGIPVLIAAIYDGTMGNLKWLSVLQGVGQLIGISLLAFPSSRRWMVKNNEKSDLQKTFS